VRITTASGEDAGLCKAAAKEGIMQVGAPEPNGRAVIPWSGCHAIRIPHRWMPCCTIPFKSHGIMALR
jgi:hypothetical protein